MLFIRPSTKNFFRESRRDPEHSLWDFIHGYIYGRWTYLYIGVAKGRHPLAKVLGPLFNVIARLFPEPGVVSINCPGGKSPKITFADTYHGKVLPLDKATRLITVDSPLILPDLEKVIPYKKARDIILENPDHIALLQCPCRSAHEDPCLPLDVCLVIGEPFAGFIVEHHPAKARRISQAEAVAVMAAEAERGHVHHAFFKDAMLNRFYAICNCCSCCCGAISAHRNGTPMLAPSGYVSKVDQELCIGCGTCAEYCQFDAMEISDGLAVIDSEKCMGCGVCGNKCEQDAITLIRDPAKGEPLDICALQSGG